MLILVRILKPPSSPWLEQQAPQRFALPLMLEQLFCLP
jgi:hypothetical protein